MTKEDYYLKIYKPSEHQLQEDKIIIEKKLTEEELKTILISLLRLNKNPLSTLYAKILRRLNK